MLFKDKCLHNKIEALIQHVSGLGTQITQLCDEHAFHRRDIMNNIEKLQEKIALISVCEAPKTTPNIQNKKKR